MKLDFETCLKQGKLSKIKPDIKLAITELNEAKSDLESAREELDKLNWKWSVEKAYYAMFHAARALLILKGYKERSHICLIIALNELYVKKGELDRKYLDFIEIAKFRREDAIYASRYDKEIAVTHVENAGKFVRMVEEFIASKKKLLS